FHVTGVQTCALPIFYFPGNGWQVFDPTPFSMESGGGFFTRLGLYIDWMQITWNEWVIGYDFAHQVGLAQNLQRGSKNWGESARAWFDRKQQDGKRWLKSWQVQHGSLGFLLPAMLVLLLVALRYNVPAEVLRRVRLFVRIRAAKPGLSINIAFAVSNRGAKGKESPMTNSHRKG